MKDNVYSSIGEPCRLKCSYYGKDFYTMDSLDMHDSVCDKKLSDKVVFNEEI